MTPPMAPSFQALPDDFALCTAPGGIGAAAGSSAGVVPNGWPHRLQNRALSPLVAVHWQVQDIGSQLPALSHVCARSSCS